jgi:hypothetical protein
MADMTPQEANAAGLGWVDKNNPNYGKAGFVGSTPGTAGGAPGASPTPSAPTSTPGIPGAVDPALKNPAPASATPLQPSPAPAIGLGNTQNGSPSAPGGRVQGDPLMAAGASPSPAANPQAQMQDALRGQIMGMLGQNVNAASVTDADIAPESRAFAGAQERYAGQRRAELAQQASREGWSDSGAFDQRLDKLSQETGQAVGANDAALVSKKLESRRAQLQQAMQAAQSMGMADEANNLQRQLANLDAQIQTRGQDITREQTGLQRELGNLDASTRIYLGDLNAKLQAEGLSSQERLARLDNEMKKYGIDVQGRLGELDAALRGQLGNRQLDLGYDQLGVNVAKTQADYNRDAVIGAMG